MTTHKPYHPARTKSWRSYLWQAAVMCAAGLMSPLAAVDVADLSPVHTKPAPQHAPLTVVAKGASAYSLCFMSPGPSERLEVMVRELQTCIELSTGVKLPIVRSKVVEPAIIIGDCADAAAAGLVGKTMPIEGFEIKTSEKNIFIVGNDEAVDASANVFSDGTAAALSEFAERFVGVRWYWPTELGGRSTLKQATLTVPPAWISDAPAFRFREYFTYPRDPILFAGLRNGSSWPIRLVVHSPIWQNNEDYRKNRPEIFQMNPDGSRDYGMYCYSHPRTLETFMEHIDAHYADTAKATFIIGNTVTVSPPDMGISCLCQACTKLYDKSAGDLGSASPIMVDFVTRLANTLTKKHPGKQILLLAYVNYTRAPAGAKLPKNVHVEVCGMAGIANYKEPKIWAADQAPIDDWIAATGNKVMEWQYTCWPSDRVQMPFQFPHVLQDFYKANREKTNGCFINAGVDREWQRFHFTLYTYLKVLWNPDFPVDAAMDGYCKRMYGPASGSVREVLQLLTDGWEKSRWPNGNLTPNAVYTHSYPKQMLERMRVLLAKAKTEAAPDAVAAKNLIYFSDVFQIGFDEYVTVMEGSGVQSMTAFKVARLPTIDGKLDEEEWNKAEPVFLKKFDEYGSKKQVDPLYPTEIKALFGLEGITFGFKLTEPRPDLLKRVVTTNDHGTTYWDDGIELFLDHTGQIEGQFTQFLVNSNGAIQDLKSSQGSWNNVGVKTKSHLAEGYWSMEVYIPFKTLGDDARGGTGVKWTIQITRNRMSDSDINKDHPREGQKLNARFGGFNANPADFTTLNFRE